MKHLTNLLLLFNSLERNVNSISLYHCKIYLCLDKIIPTRFLLSILVLIELSNLIQFHFAFASLKNMARSER